MFAKKEEGGERNRGPAISKFRVAEARTERKNKPNARRTILCRTYLTWLWPGRGFITLDHRRAWCLKQYEVGVGSVVCTRARVSRLQADTDQPVNKQPFHVFLRNHDGIEPRSQVILQQPVMRLEQKRARKDDVTNMMDLSSYSAIRMNRPSENPPVDKGRFHPLEFFCPSLIRLLQLRICRLSFLHKHRSVYAPARETIPSPGSPDTPSCTPPT